MQPSRHPRHFIITSSVGAFVGLAGYAPYGPAKSALRSLADSLRSELNLYNGMRASKSSSSSPAQDVQIHCVFPGSISSPGLDLENTHKHPVTKILEEGDTIQNEDEVADAAVKGLERGEFMIPTAWLGYLMQAGMLGGSARGRLIVDTVMSWVASLAWLFVGPDMDGKVWKYGKTKGVGLPA